MQINQEPRHPREMLASRDLRQLSKTYTTAQYCLQANKLILKYIHTLIL